MDYFLLKSVLLTEKNQPTGKTVHNVYGKLMGKPAILQIAQYPNDNGVYLFYLDENKKIITDTYHDKIDDAMSQANWEFNVGENDWTDEENVSAK